MSQKKQNHFHALFAGIAFALFSVPTWSVNDKDSQGAAFDIVVTAKSGRVDLTTAGAERDVGPGSLLELPSRIVTGADGHFAIRQSRTGVTMAPDSEIEVPETARQGQLVARLIQHRGNVFYDVEKRPVEKLKVETPYLVAVVKGTQFNVAVTDAGTTISLFEGLLEIATPDGSQVVELEAGEIAIRSPVDDLIRVLPMDADRLDLEARLDIERIGTAARLATVDARADSSLGGADAGIAIDAGTVAAVADDASLRDLGRVTDASFAPEADLNGEIDLDTRVDLDGAGVDAALDGSADLRGASVGTSLDADLDTGVDLGGAAADVGLDADLGGASVDTSLDAGLDTGVDLGGGTADVGLDVGLDAGVDLGGASVDTSLDAGLDTGVDLGGASVDAGLDVGLDLGGDSDIDADVDLGLDTGVDTLDATVDTVDDTLDETVDTVEDTLDPVIDVLDGDDGGGLLGPLF